MFTAIVTISSLTRRNESEPKLKSWPQFLDEPLCVHLNGVSRELVLDVVEDVADGVHVSEVRHLLVDLRQHLVEVYGHVEQGTHVPLRVKPLQERTDLY